MTVRAKKLNHKITFTVINFVFFTFLFLMLSSCTSNAVSKQKSISALLGCENSDAYNDLLYSLEGIKKLTKKNNIKVNIKNNDKRCGYLLVWNSEKYIAGVLTDYDLMMEVTSFFKLR